MMTSDLTPDELRAHLNKLGLHGFLAQWDEIAGQPWLRQLIAIEEAERQRRSLARRLDDARLGAFKPIADFDWGWPRKIDRQALDDLFGLGYIAEGINVILVGPNGVGKTMLLKNLAYHAILRGHTVRAAGFQETRKLQCWTYAADAPSAGPIARGSMRPEYCDVAPSWQSSTASIRRAHDRFEILGGEDGYAVVFPSNGDLAQLAVAPAARRRGLGTRLLRDAATLAGKPLRILNVDDRSSDIAAFLEAAGARRTIRQLEMELLL